MDSPDWNAMLQGLLSNTNLTAIIKIQLNQEQNFENLAQCKRYALFAWSLSRAGGEAVYWSCLAGILICLMASTSTLISEKQHHK
jgi:hypothetical protein